MRKDWQMLSRKMVIGLAATFLVTVALSWTAAAQDDPAKSAVKTDTPAAPPAKSAAPAKTAAPAASKASQPAAAPLPALPPGGELVVYSSDIHDTEDAVLKDAPAIALVGARNGAFSGKVVARSANPILELKARMGELQSAGGAMPASAVSVRFGTPWEEGMRYRPRGNDMLYESAPEYAAPRGGAKATVWVTVRVPREAKAGSYSGQLTIEAKGQKAVLVPVKIEVADWTLPETKDYVTWIELIQSPETLAVEYNLPFWSEKHWQMIDKSLKMIAESGCRVVNVPLVGRINNGASETMVRWIKKADGKYDHDYTVLDKYLDLVAKEMTQPKIVIFYAWDLYLKPPAAERVTVKEGDSDYAKEEKEKLATRAALKGKGPAVSVLKADGTTETVFLPPLADPESKALWQPVWKEIRNRMAKRGWEKSMMIGMLSDEYPTKDELAFFNEVSGGLPFTCTAHHARWTMKGDTEAMGSLEGGLAKVGYTAIALDFQYVINPAKGRMYGWKKPMLHAEYWRFGMFNSSTNAWIRSEPEANITGSQRGIGHLGGDLWPCIKNKKGVRMGTVGDRFPESYWHSLNVGASMLAPGPDGPVATARFEVFREGVQECEARIAIEKVLLDAGQKARIGAELAKKAQEILDERQVAIWKSRGADEAAFEKGLMTQYREIIDMANKWNAAAGNKWFTTSGWQERDGQLFSVAGEVARKLGAN